MKLTKYLLIFILYFIFYVKDFLDIGEVLFININNNFIFKSLWLISITTVVSFSFFMFEIFIIGKDRDKTIFKKIEKEDFFLFLYFFIYTIIAYIFLPSIAGYFYVIFCLSAGFYIAYYVSKRLF